MREMRYVLLAVLMAFAAPVQAFSCLFESECYEDQGCAESQFTIEVLLEHEIIATDFGDLTIVAVKSSDTLITLFATGSSSEYMMSVTPRSRPDERPYQQGSGDGGLSGHLRGGVLMKRCALQCRPLRNDQCFVPGCQSSCGRLMLSNSARRRTKLKYPINLVRLSLFPKPARSD